MNIKQIVTHPGGAHKDEFIACSLLVSLYNVPIYRREPSAEDLADKETCVVDIGGEHSPENRNFDHHQFPRDYPPCCSISLILQHLGVYDDAKAFCDWLEPAEWFDTRGPGVTAKWLGVERDAMAKLNSPIDITLLRRFAKHDELAAGNPIYEVMKMVGEDMLDYVQNLRQKLDYIESHCEHWEIPAGNETIKAIFLPRTEPLADEPSMGLGRYILSRQLENEVAAIIYPDRRAGGYGIARFNDHPQMDFNAISDEEDVHFVHNSGFLAKTSATDPQRLQGFVKSAWSPLS